MSAAQKAMSRIVGEKLEGFAFAGGQGIIASVVAHLRAIHVNTCHSRLRFLDPSFLHIKPCRAQALLSPALMFRGMSRYLKRNRKHAERVGRVVGPSVCQEHPHQQLAKLSEKDREELLAKFLEADIDFGPNYQQAIVLAACKTAASPDAWLDILYPFPDAEGSAAWAPLRPRLRAAALDDVCRARILLRVLYHDKLIPAFSKGLDGLQEVKDVTHVVEKMLERRQKSSCKVGFV